jgi:hypothetical protein
LITSFRSHAAAQTPSVIFSSCARAATGQKPRRFSQSAARGPPHARLPIPRTPLTRKYRTQRIPHATRTIRVSKSCFCRLP